ncbi:hypothetical protein HUJ04_011246 [Dendroctonus ponderosae]|nr:hypothetical protein HUJ04_011246 [Dendroctonus ponderosae]
MEKKLLAENIRQCFALTTTELFRAAANKKLYFNQTAEVWVEDIETDEIKIQKDVRQGCVLSPQLFTLYSQFVFQRVLNNREEGVKIGGTLINNFRPAGKTAIITDYAEEPQRILEKVNRACEEVGLTINIEKTKYMVISQFGLTSALLILPIVRGSLFSYFLVDTKIALLALNILWTFTDVDSDDISLKNILKSSADSSIPKYAIILAKWAIVTVPLFFET